ncbi:MAG: gliding motility protein GldL [Bacteroidales bacterium]|nr:gliding motility protein GldL [Bacteroidales bacterium]
MGIRRRYKNFIEKFLSGDTGKRFFQAFYSIGAAIVIIGALAKLNHWPGGTFLLTVGMVTEFFVFLISAFDRPSKEYQWDRVFPVLDTGEESDRPDFKNGNGNGGSVIIGGAGEGSTSATASEKGNSGGGSVIVGGVNFGGGFVGNGGTGSPKNASEAVENMSAGEIRQSFGIPNAVNISEEDTNALTASIKKMAAAADQLGKMAEMTEATQEYLDQVSAMSEDMKKFSVVTNNLTDVSDILLNSYKSITDNSDGISLSSRGYVQQMENLNRNIQGLNTIYEIQLKSISSQIDAIEKINSGLMRIRDLYEGSIVDSSVFRTETERMAHQLQQLNGVYSRLLNAMTVNMYATPGYPPAGNYNPNPQNPGSQQTPNV